MISQFIDALDRLISAGVGVVWNYPVVILCLLGALYFSLRFRFVQIKGFPHALGLLSGKYDNPNEHGQITHFQALAAALSGTIGLGNIAGVAIAIGLGGPGAIFWMWIVAFFGMASKFVECTLGTHYRDENPETGEVRGGPMHYMTKGLGEKWRPMALFYGTCVFLGAFGAGNMFQANQAASAFADTFGTPVWVTGLILSLMVGVVIIGGIQRIGQVASKIVPFMCGLYITGALYVCAKNFHLIGSVYEIIVRDAFTGMAAAGGSVGAVVIWGVRRAIFSNEAGLGTAAIAHAAVKTDYPVREGIVASMGPFIDTIVVCTATAMVIITSGFFGTEAYQAFQKQTVSFEQTLPNLYGGDDWQVSSKAPENTTPLQKVRASDYALKHSGKSASITQLPAVSVEKDGSQADGIRFSYYRESGDMILRLVDGKQKILTMVPLASEQALEATNDLVSTQGQIATGEWQSVVLKFSDDFKAQLSESGTQSLHVQFLPLGENNVWYFDRIQAIEDAQGIVLTTNAFEEYFGKYARIFITIAVFFFAFSTLITWYYYGETSVKFVFGDKAPQIYRYVFVIGAFVGSINALSLVLNFSDLMIGLMVIPNMIALIILTPKVRGWAKDYFAKLKAGEIKPYK